MTESRRFTLRVHPAGAFAFLLALFFGPLPSTLAAALALGLHEAAHGLCLRAFGLRCLTIELTPFGGLMDAPGYERLKCGAQVLIALSGVLISAAAFALCAYFAPPTAFWRAFLNINLSLAFLNCLPLWPLDGARALLALAARLGVGRACLRVTMWLSYGCAAFLLALGLYGAWRGTLNLTLLLAAPYLCYAAKVNAVSRDVLAMRRAAEADGKLQSGGMLPVRLFACVGEPSVLMLTRLLSTLTSDHFCVLMTLDRDTNAVERLYTEGELARKCFADTFHKSQHDAPTGT